MYQNTKTYAAAIFFLTIGTVASTAQRRYRSHLKQVSPAESIAKSYTDSLAAYRQTLDSLQRANDSLLMSASRLYRLFSPMTYYGDVTSNSFSLDGDTTSTVDRTLMDVYLRHPEYVKQSARTLDGYADNGISTAPAPSAQAPRPKKVDPLFTPSSPTTYDDVIDFYVAKPKMWTFAGDYYLQFMQNHVSENWYKSGSSNYSLLGSVTLQYNYDNKKKVKWDNKLEMKLGFLNTEADTVNTFKTSEDLLRLTSKFGLQATKRWYYTLQMVASTQFTQGRKNNKKTVYSDFCSPLNVNLSLGMDYTIETKDKRLTGSAHLAPLAYNLKYVSRTDLATSFGLDEGENTLSDWGSQCTVELLWKPFDMMTWQSRFYAYTTYHKFELEWENTLTFNFNRYISTKLFLYPRFDDSAKRVNDLSYLQFKEYLSVGFSYSM